MAMSNEQRISFAVDYRVDTTSLQDARKSLQELQKMSLETFNSIGNNRAMANSAEQLTNLKQSALQLEQALARSFNADLGVTNVQRLRQELSGLDLRNIGERFALAGAAGQNAFNSIAGQALNLNNTLKQTGPILTKIQQTFTNALSWNLVTGVFNKVTQAVSQAWGYSKNLDESLNSIRIITRQSAEEMERFAETAQKAAKGLGRGTVDYTDAALIYYQQGLSDEEVAKKTETTLKTANVTGKSAEDVSELLTAVWNGYKVDAEEAELYVDKLAAVAATTASDLGELSTAMSKVASVASTTGVDIDQLNAQISTIISVTRQAPESVGTALKTIYSRIGDLQVDGVDEFGVSLGKVSSKLKTMGVDILDKNGDMREMGVVFEEVADKWANWTSAQKQAAAVVLGGSRQYTNLFALFENWDKYENTLVTSSKAVGTLQEQQDINTEKLTTHLQQLRTAWEGVYNSAFDKETAIKTIDSLTSMVEKLEKFFDTVGGGIPVLKLLSSMLLSTFSTKIATGFTNFIENSLISLRNFTNQQERAQRQVENMMRNLGVQNQNFSQYQITSLADTSRMFRSRQDVITEEELNRVNSSMERTIQLENQMNTNAEEVRRTRTFLQGLGMVFDDGMSLQQNLDQVGSQLSGINYGRDFENRRQMFSQIASGRRTDFGQLSANYSQELAAILTSQRQVDAITESVNARRIARGDAELTSEQVQNNYLTNTRTGLQFLGEQLNGVATTFREIVQQEAGASVSRIGPAQQHIDRTIQDQNRQDTYDATIAQNLADANLRNRQYEILREGAQLLNPTPDANPNLNIAASRAESTRLAVRRNALLNLYQHGGINVVTQQQQPGEDQLREDVRQLLVTDLGRILQDAETRLNEAGRDLVQADTRYQAADRAYRQAQQSGDQAAIQQAHQDFVAAGNNLLTANQAHADAEQERNRVRDLHTLANAGDMNSFTTLYNADPQLQATTDAVNRYQELDNLVVTSTQEATTRITEEYNRRIQAQNQITRDLRTRASELRTEYDNISQAIANQTERLTGQQVAVQTLDQAMTTQRRNYEDLGGDIAHSTDEFIQNSEAIQTNVSNYEALGQKLLKDRHMFEQMNAYGMISDADYESIRASMRNVVDETTGRVVAGIDTLPDDISTIGRTMAEVLQRTGMSYEQAQQTITQAREQQLASARAELQQITAEQQELMRTLNMRQVAQSAAQLATGMTSLASSGMMFKNAWKNIISNEDLSSWEKMTQLLGSVGPMLIGMAPQIKNLGSIIAKGAVAVVDAGEAERAATMSIRERMAAIDRSNLTEQQRAIAQAKHISLTGQEITEQEAEIIVTEEQIAAQKRYAEVSALSMNVLLVVIGAAIAALAWGLSKMHDAQKEAEESAKKASEVAQEVTERNKELRKTVEDNIKAFDEWEDLWESFKKGKVAVDDVKTSMENLIEQFGLSDDLEYQRLLRIAEYTQDYSELEKKLDDIISKQKQVASGTYDVALKNQKTLFKTSLNQLDTKVSKFIPNKDSATEINDYIKDNNINDILQEVGADTVHTAQKGYKLTVKAKDLTEEQVRQLSKHRDIFQQMAAEENAFLQDLGDMYLRIIDHTAGTIAQIDNLKLEKAIDDTLNNIEFSRPEGTEKEQLLDIEEQVQSTIQTIKDVYGKEIEDKDLEDIELKIRNKFLQVFPKSKDILEESDHLTKEVKEALEKGRNELARTGKLIPGFTQERIFTTEDLAGISEQLKGIGKDVFDIDWDAVAGDLDLINKILIEKGELSDETLQAIAKHLTEAGKAAGELTADFDALGATWDDVNKKLEKNSLTDRNLKSNKEFQSLIDEDTTKQLKEFYGAASDVGKAIDIITNEDISSSSNRWREAWKIYGEAIKNADIEQSLQNINEEMDKLSPKKGEIQVQADAYDYYEVMDDILAEDYDIDVNIHGRIDTELEKIKSDLDDSVKLVTKIGEGFTLSANELNDFADDMPEVLDEMQVLSDGSIQLSQTAVESAKKAAIEKANEEIDSEIQVIKAQRAVVEHKKETVEEMLKIADKMANGQYKTEDALKKAQTKLNEQALDLEQDDKVQAAIAEGKLQKDQLTKLASYYEAGLKQTAQYVTKRNKILEGFNLKETNYKIDTFAEGLDLYNSEFYQMKGTGVIRDRLTQESIDNQIELGKHLQEVLNAQKDEYQSIIDSYDTDIKVMEAYKKNYQATWDAVGKATDKNTDSKDKNKDATDKQSAAEAKLIDLLEEEIDAYHDINILIKELDTNLSRLQKQQSKLYGKDLIDNLKQQGELLDQQISNYEEKIRLSQMELAVTKQRLQAEDVQFNADGTVSNYSAAMQKKIDYIRDLQTQYNAMSAEDQENFKNTLDEAEKAYDKFKENMEKYDQLLTEDIPELEDQIQDAIDSQIELKISAFETEVQLKLDTAEAEKNMREFRRKVIDQLKDDDILGNALADYADLSYYRNEQGLGIVQIYTDQLSAINQAIAEIESSGWSERFGDDMNSAMEAQKEAQNNLRQALMDEQDAIKNIKDAYLSMIDEAKEKWDEQTEAYNKLSSLINHDMNIIKLLYGENKSYAMLDKYYQKQNEYNAQQLDMYMREAEQWKARLKDAEEGSELWKKFKEYYEEAVENSKATFETSIQGIIDTYTNAINKIFKELEDKMTNGLGFDNFKNDWDYLNKETDRYLDSINSAYEIQKLENEMKEKIKETDDVKIQKQLTDIMNEQLDTLKQRDKLTQYDLDRAQALYDIEVKKIALKEAQQNKSKMRLRRDSQGNYSYQFVSDEDNVAAAAQELAEAQNSLYNLDKNAYKSNLDEIYDVYYEYNQKVQELYEDAFLSKDEKERRYYELTERYQESLVGLTQQHEQLKLNLKDSAFQELAKMYGRDVNEYQEMSDQEQEILMSQTVPMWGSAMDLMADAIGEQGLMGITKDAFQQLQSAVDDYGSAIEEVTEKAGDYFKDIEAGEDLIVTAMEEMIPVNDVVITQWAEMTDRMKDLALSAVAFADGLSAISQNAFAALEGSRLYDEYQQEKAQEQAKANAEKKVDNAMSNSKDATRGLDYNRDDWGAGNFPKIGDKVTYLGDYYFYDSLGTAPLGNRGEGQNKTVTVQNVAPNNPFPVAVMSNDSAYGWLKKYQIAKMDTGGYTGNWGSSDGKIGILHQKELVLNAYDTENFLKAMEIIEGMLSTNTLSTKMINNMNNKIFDVGELMTEYTSALTKMQEDMTQTIQQTVNVDAQFPNARDAEEILLAFENLSNKMTQYAHSTKR